MKCYTCEHFKEGRCVRAELCVDGIKEIAKAYEEIILTERYVKRYGKVQDRSESKT